MRLIDADVLREQFQAILDRGDMFCEYDIVGMVDNEPTVELTETEVQEILNKRCMTAVANEYLISLHGNRPTDLLRELKDCRNELCYRCGQYANAHLGVCDGCRWNDENMKRWEESDEE